MRILPFSCAAAVLLPIAGAGAVPLDDLKKFDLNHDNKLSGEELLASRLHENKVIATLDVNFDGKISAAELGQVAEIRKKEVHRLRWETQRYENKFGKSGGAPLDEYATAPEAPPFDECDDQQGLYIRRDKADLSFYATKSIDTALAKGASATATSDNVKNVDTANINGVVSYVVARNPCNLTDVANHDINKAALSGYAVAPWLLLQGQLNDSQQDKSTVRIGLDTQATVFGGQPFGNQIYTAAPYYQTDFDLEASAYGFNATWEPYWLDYRLGGRKYKPTYLDFWWRLIAEADALYVDEPGETDLKADTEYAWLGGTARANFGFLPKLLDNRLYGVAEVAYFWDAASGRDIVKYSGEVGVNLNADGSTSVSVQYSNGTNKSDLQEVDQITFNLNFKQ